MRDASPSLLIYLHGMNSDGSQFRELSQHLQHLLPQTFLVALDAPFASDGGAGRQWFGLQGLTDANRAPRFEKARQALDELLTRAIAEHGFSNMLEHVALVGFSQGAIMALDTVASGRWPVGAVVSLAGRLITQDPLAPPPGTRALLVHGKDDDVITATYTDDAYTRLVGAGMSVERHVLHGVGHAMSAPVIEIARRFLLRIFAGPDRLVRRSRIG